MKESKVIEELKKYNRLKNRTIPNILNKLEVINYELEGVSGMEYSDMPSPTGCKKESYKKEKLIDEKTVLENKLKVHKAFVKYIETALSKLDPIAKKILVECFAKDKFEKLNNENLCSDLNISLSTLYRERKKVIKIFSKDLY
ncbi:hypothetical protein [Clostridium sp. Ade.TY]|uniref:hypothetical protein n=1 Tax=Clostridium sp. Ade.TY TaxID=1391647 RepID=UPI00041A5602|nr:hypothetical protein [Clostridium sp. Ade.TY]